MSDVEHTLRPINEEARRAIASALAKALKELDELEPQHHSEQPREEGEG